MGLLSLFPSFIHDIQDILFYAYDDASICSFIEPNLDPKDDVEKLFLIHGIPSLDSATIWDVPLDRNIDYSITQEDFSSNVCHLPFLDDSPIWNEPLDKNMNYSLSCEIHLDDYMVITYDQPLSMHPIDIPSIHEVLMSFIYPPKSSL